MLTHLKFAYYICIAKAYSFNINRKKMGTYQVQTNFSVQTVQT